MSNYYEYMFGANKPAEKQVEDTAATSQVEPKEGETVVMDEAIGPWTHKFVVYCKNPKKEFEEELKAKDGVVAVFVKEKESVATPAEANPPNNK